MPSDNFTRRRLRRRQEKFVDSLNLGEFAGKFSLEWLGPECFNYKPDTKDPFRFIRKDKDGNIVEEIIPQVMETDGGSVPKLLQAVPGLSAWAYGPAYLIHDWEFLAYDLARVEEGFYFDKSFEEVNLTLAEGIWTLMNNGYCSCEKPECNKGNVQAIYSAVMTPFARRLWEDLDF